MTIHSIEKEKALSHEKLLELISYDPVSGEMAWNKGRPGASTGTPCGTKKPNGYVVVAVYRRLFRAHRLAWFYMTGEWPKDEIDHLNGDRSDNRFCNLRECSRSQNGFNKSVRKDSKVGAKNVLYYPEWGRFSVRLRVQGKDHTFGPFDSLDAASACAVQKRIELHQSFARN